MRRCAQTSALESEDIFFLGTCGALILGGFSALARLPFSSCARKSLGKFNVNWSKIYRRQFDLHEKMLSTKRKAAGVDLQRRVRARVDSDEEVEVVDSGSSSGESDSQDEKSEGSEVQIHVCLMRSPLLIRV